MKIVVLSITPYKEKDAIIDAVNEQGEMTFLAKGILDPKNKNSALNNLLAVADIELNEGNYKHPVLKSASIIENPMKVTNDYYYLCSLMLMAEVTKSLVQDDEKERIFNSLMSAVICMKTAESPWPILLSYFAKVFKETGYEFEVNHCVFCGSKQGILTFSFNDGGFICQNCLEPDMERDLTKEQMLIIRSSFLVPDIARATFEVSKEDALVVLNKFFEFIKDSYGVTLKGAALINQ